MPWPWSNPQPADSGLYSPSERGAPDPEPSDFNVGDVVVSAGNAQSGAPAVGDERRKPLKAPFTLPDGIDGVVKGVDQDRLFVAFGVEVDPRYLNVPVDMVEVETGQVFKSPRPDGVPTPAGTIPPGNRLFYLDAPDENTWRMRTMLQFNRDDWFNKQMPDRRKWGRTHRQADDDPAKARVMWQGLPVHIEFFEGEERPSVAGDRTAPAHYAYIDGTEAMDGDSVDIMLGPDYGNPELDVYVVEQLDFDEPERVYQYKTFAGFPDKTSAHSAFLALWPEDVLGATYVIDPASYVAEVLPYLDITGNSGPNYGRDNITWDRVAMVPGDAWIDQRLASGLLGLQGLPELVGETVVDVALAQPKWGAPHRRAFVKEVAKQAQDRLGWQVKDMLGDKLYDISGPEDALELLGHVFLVLAPASNTAAEGLFGITDEGAPGAVVNLTKLLPDRKPRDPELTKQRVAQVAAHELRHAADWTFNPVRHEQESREHLADPVHDKGRDFGKYINMPSEQRAYAGTVADELRRIYGPDVSGRSGPELVRLMERHRPDVMQALDPAARPDFMTRVVKELDHKRRTALPKSPLGERELRKWLGKPHSVAFISPYRQDLSAQQNKRRMQQLRRDLHELGVAEGDIKHLEGMYEEEQTGEEKREGTVMVRGLGFDAAKQLAAEYGQDAFIYKSPEGSMGMYGDKWTVPGTPTFGPGQHSKGRGIEFDLDFDFDQSLPAREEPLDVETTQPDAPTEAPPARAASRAAADASERRSVGKLRFVAEPNGEAVPVQAQFVTPDPDLLAPEFYEPELPVDYDEEDEFEPHPDAPTPEPKPRLTEFPEEDTVTPEGGAENIRGIMALATPEEIDYWANWYDVAHQEVKDLAAHLNMPLDVVAGVTAAISPNLRWDTNIDAAEQILLRPDFYKKRIEDRNAAIKEATERAGVERFNQLPKEEQQRIARDYTLGGVPVYSRNIQKALNIIESGDPTTGVKGPKVEVFYNSMVDPKGTRRDIVLDGHAINIWRGDKATGLSDMRGLTKPQRQQMVEDYEKVASEYGLQSQEVQAITWSLWRQMLGVAQPGGKSKAARLYRVALDVVHFSTTPGLDALDPSHVGSGSLSLRESQDKRVPVTFFYTAGTEPESLVTSRARARYEARIPDNLLDLAQAPTQVRRAFKQGRGEGYAAIRDMGYFGFYNSNSALPNAVAVFYSVPVMETQFVPTTEVGQERIPRAAQPVEPDAMEDAMLAPFEQELEDEDERTAED